MLRRRDRAGIERLREAMAAAGLGEDVPADVGGIDEAEMMVAEEGGEVKRLEKGRENGMTGCGKVGYSSESKARKTIRRRQGSGAGRLRPYFCPSCHKWHISSTRKAPQR